MQGLAVVLFPVLLMFFALAMERVETRLRRLSVREHEVQEFLEQANSSEVDALAHRGMHHALDRFHRRRRRRRGADDPEAGSIDAGASVTSATASPSGLVEPDASAGAGEASESDDTDLGGVRRKVG